MQCTTSARQRNAAKCVDTRPLPPPLSASTPPADSPARKIVHVDMDAFYASVEQRDDPALRGRPVVVAWTGPRSVVCAASYEARRFGVRSAMPAVRAARMCPQAVFVPPDFPRYQAVSRQVRQIFARHTERIEPLSLDEAYLDVSHNLQALPSATAVAEAIRAAVRSELQLTCSAGVAPNKFLAKIASDWNKPDGLCVIRPAQVEAFLAPLPVGRLPGVGKVSVQRLEGVGIRTVAELRRWPLKELEQRFGSFGRRLHRLARGIDHSTVESDRPRRSLSAEDTFRQDLPLSQLEEAIRRLGLKVWRDSQAADWTARTVVLKLKTADFQLLTRSHTADSPPDSADSLIDCALRLRERVDLPPSTLFRLVGVGLAGGRDADAPVQKRLTGL